MIKLPRLGTVPRSEPAGGIVAAYPHDLGPISAHIMSHVTTVRQTKAGPAALRSTMRRLSVPSESHPSDTDCGTAGTCFNPVPVARFQALCGITDKTGGHSWLHFIFTWGAVLGTEPFFLLLLPGILWFVDITIGRRIITLWACSFLVSHVCKDTLRMSRPDKRDVIVLETTYAAEYGMPSTHAMNAACMPFYLAYLVEKRWPELVTPWTRLVSGIICFGWFAACSLSRLYLGVHNVADVLAGWIIGVVFLSLGIHFGGPVDHFFMTTPWSSVYVVILCCAAVALYPRPAHWVNSPGDTATIVAST